MSDLLGLDKAIMDTNPSPFDIWSELFHTIERDKNTVDGLLLIHWGAVALSGMNRANLEEIEKLMVQLNQ